MESAPFVLALRYHIVGITCVPTCVCSHSQGTLTKPWTPFLSGVLSCSHWFASLSPGIGELVSDSPGVVEHSGRGRLLGLVTPTLPLQMQHGLFYARKIVVYRPGVSAHM